MSNISVIIILLMSVFGVVLLLALIVGILLLIFLPLIKRGRAQNKGKKYTAIIYGYQKSERMYVNGKPVVNTTVRYFDDEGVKREALLKTKFVQGSGDYPIGGLIDISVYKDAVSWDKKSVRYDNIDREEELMENKPIDTSKLKVIKITCKSCGASYEATEGYVSKCPHCGRAVDF